MSGIAGLCQNPAAWALTGIVLLALAVWRRRRREKRLPSRLVQRMRLRGPMPPNEKPLSPEEQREFMTATRGFADEAGTGRPVAAEWAAEQMMRERGTQ